MKSLAIGFTLLFATSFSALAVSSPSSGMSRNGPEIVEHGGGCRKSSPPGKCCHMDNKAGSVHCH
ncbi:hypothetical protein B9K09_13700 [Pseudomonas sp. M30-35]|nr:hypothetical protein B9K09_13700 [Pseudomonas sp. M30-35]